MSETQRIFDWLAGVGLYRCVYVVRSRWQRVNCKHCGECRREKQAYFVTRLYVRKIDVTKQEELDHSDHYYKPKISVNVRGTYSRDARKMDHETFRIGERAFLTEKDANNAALKLNSEEAK